ncbi:MAG: 3-dehydroquinate synthase [Propionibacteriaceae bacterium]|nr:3-dehydroquinate synthase [Propionibacteriaceae bacterium]
MSIALIGMPGAGKSTVGAALAAELGVDFLDTDEMIEQDTGLLITEIFAQQGEHNFRYLEGKATEKALNTAGVVALGGGAILSQKVRTLLNDHQVVWLDMGTLPLLHRVSSSSHRPLLDRDIVVQLDDLARERLHLYQGLADIVVSGLREIEEIVTQIIDWLHRTTIVRVGGPRNQDYKVGIGRGILERLVYSEAYCLGQGGVADVSRATSHSSQVVILHPAALADQARHIQGLVPNSSTYQVPTGEEAKTVATLESCWRHLATLGMTRLDAIIGLGGGSTTDLAGFVAATYLRGVKFLSIPTTVLGMADAAVGGKTGINLPEGKNLVGAFYEPSFVLCDLDLLETLPIEEVRGGLAEIIKCGFISDVEILTAVTKNDVNILDVSSEVFTDVLHRAIEVKATVVSRDFRETAIDYPEFSPDSTGGRAALNYGHTLGHAIEKQENYTWSHGEAVSVGMVYAAEVALRLGLISSDIVDLHRKTLSSVGLPITYSSAAFADLRQTMSRDKKARGPSLKFVLLESIGKTTIVADIDEEILEDAYKAIAE